MEDFNERLNQIQAPLLNYYSQETSAHVITSLTGRLLLAGAFALAQATVQRSGNDYVLTPKKEEYD